jgi:AraC-like DNA-binding protein/ligand-binding sensor protein
MSKTTSIIQRRELEPVLLKARKVVQHYERAADCRVSIVGPDGNKAKPANFCVLCSQYCQARISTENPGKKDCTFACGEMHRNATEEARRLGGSYIYVCPAGMIFWTSPLYAGERFAGTLMSEGVLGTERQEAAENFFRLCNGAVSKEEINRCLAPVPEKTGDEIKALAQMMLICADQISGTSSVVSSEEVPVEARPASVDVTAGSYPMETERMFLASLRRGDIGEARKILKTLLETLHRSSAGNFRVFQLRAIEIAVLLFRAAAGGTDTGEQEEAEADLEANNRYLKKIEDALEFTEITAVLNTILDRMSGRIFSFQGVRHSSALRKAERFIWENYTRKVSLQEIAEASGLSAPYFSTVFKDEMGENLSNYLNRLRVEKAIVMLSETNQAVSEIAQACGFDDQSWFSKIFKSFTGMSPGKYREQGGLLN